MLHSALLNVMIKAARRAGRGLKRDLGEVENLQVSLKGPANFVTVADKRAGIDQDIDEEEQSDQQNDRAPPVRLDVAVKAVSRHEIPTLLGRPLAPAESGDPAFCRSRIACSGFPLARE